MPQTLFVSYGAIDGFEPGLHKIGSVIVCCASRTGNTDGLIAIPRIREMLTSGLYLPAIPRAVVYFGMQVPDLVKAMIRELLPPDTRLVTCRCHYDEKQLFAMGHRFPITLGECGGRKTMARLVSEALGN